MRHWDGRDRDDGAELRLSRQDRARLAHALRMPSHKRREPVHVGSMIGLVLAVGVLVGLAFLLAPDSPVSSKLVN